MNEHLDRIGAIVASLEYHQHIQAQTAKALRDHAEALAAALDAEQARSEDLYDAVEEACGVFTCDGTPRCPTNPMECAGCQQTIAYVEKARRRYRDWYYDKNREWSAIGALEDALAASEARVGSLVAAFHELSEHVPSDGHGPGEPMMGVALDHGVADILFPPTCIDDGDLPEEPQP